ncbi:MAG: amidohydrolase family protein [bacterium]
MVRRPDAVVVPGLVDSHAHLTNLGRARTRLDLMETTSIEAITAQVAAAAQAGRGGSWGVAGTRTTGRSRSSRPCRAGCGERGAASGADPGRRARPLGQPGGPRGGPDRARHAGSAGGRILRRPDGRPSGVLIDTAMDAVLGVIPPPTPAATRQAILAGIEACHRVGLTGVHDAGTGAQELAVLEQLDAPRRPLPLRVYAMLWGDDPAIDRLVAQGRGRAAC